MAQNHTFKHSGVYKDFNINMESHPLTNDLGVKNDANAINQALRNLINTNFYERPFNPTLGCNIRALLFEPASPFTVLDIRDAITQTITNHEPRVALRDVYIEDNSDLNSYSVKIIYTTLVDPEPVQFDFILERLR